MDIPLTASLRELGLLDPAPDAALDRLSRLAATVLKAPAALMSFPDGEHQFFKSFVGLPEPFATTRRGVLGGGLTDRVRRAGRALALSDVGSMEESALPLVRAFGVGAFLGVPISTRSHGIIGVLAVYDHVPRSWSEQEIEILHDLAASVITEIEWRHEFAEHARARDALRESEAMHRAIVNASPDLLLRMDRHGTYLGVMAGMGSSDLIAPREVLIGRRHAEVLPPEAAAAVAEGIEQALDTRRVQRVEYTLEINGEARHFEARVVAVTSDEALLIVRNVTERLALEAQFRQAQKMEAVGRLAGGVAHDFNNLLTAIRGNAELLLLDVEPDSPAHEDLEEIRRAADRAASLTRQLVAFSRRQPLKPHVLDLNVLLGDAEKMLARLIGEDIEFVVARDPRLGTVRADPGQLEQVIMNLVVNARDAMPRGGRLVIETAEMEMDAATCRRYGILEPGRYVVLSVSDTGVGISPEVRERLFEPFFTTKEVGKGTGLGLSTVYGIVKQSGGYVWVESEPGQGSTFRVFLPRLEEEEAVVTGAPPRPVAARGARTVLLVEDEGAVRRLAHRILARHGFTVLEAASAQEALRVASEYPAEIHLVLTDVVMPGMSGVELARSLAALRPSLRVLFMSGYTEEVIDPHGAREAGVALLEKPFSTEALLRAVAEVLAPM